MYSISMSNPKLETPAFAEAPARRTRLWQAGLRAGRLNSKQTQMSKVKSQNYPLSFIVWICLGFRV
jgi:hypothetical protein